MNRNGVIQAGSQILDANIRKIVKQEMSQILKGYFEAGEIVAINGNRADVKINGSADTTPNVPIKPGETIAVNDEVWIIKINYSDIDKMILCKRPI